MKREDNLEIVKNIDILGKQLLSNAEKMEDADLQMLAMRIYLLNQRILLKLRELDA